MPDLFKSIYYLWKIDLKISLNKISKNHNKVWLILCSIENIIKNENVTYTFSKFKRIQKSIKFFDLNILNQNQI